MDRDKGRGGAGGLAKVDIKFLNVIIISQCEYQGGQGGGNTHPPKVDNQPVFVEPFPQVNFGYNFFLVVLYFF